MKNLSKIMEIKGMTSASLAESIGISKVAMSNIITKKSMPGIDKVEKMAKVLGVTVSEIIGEMPEQNIIVCPKCGTKLEVKEKE